MNFEPLGSEHQGVFFLEVFMSEKIKEIADFWLNNEFLEKFKQVGERYLKQIKEEENERRLNK